MASMLDRLFGLDREPPNVARARRLDHTMDLVEQLALDQGVMFSMIIRMGNRMATWDTFNRNLTTLVEGYRSATAKNLVYEQQLADVDKRIQDAVSAALAADDAVDQQAIDAADQVIVDGLQPPDDGPDSPEVPDASPPVDAPQTGPVDDTPDADGTPAGNA